MENNTSLIQFHPSVQKAQMGEKFGVAVCCLLIQDYIDTCTVNEYASNSELPVSCAAVAIMIFLHFKDFTEEVCNLPKELNNT